jgi:hypothetical protein
MLKVDVYKVIMGFNAPLTTKGIKMGISYGSSVPSVSLEPGEHLIISSSDFDELAVYAKKNKSNNLVHTILSEEFVQKNPKLFKKIL